MSSKILPTHLPPTVNNFIQVREFNDDVFHLVINDLRTTRSPSMTSCVILVSLSPNFLLEMNSESGKEETETPFKEY